MGLIEFSSRRRFTTTKATSFYCGPVKRTHVGPHRVQIALHRVGDVAHPVLRRQAVEQAVGPAVGTDAVLAPVPKTLRQRHVHRGRVRHDQRVPLVAAFPLQSVVVTADQKIVAVPEDGRGAVAAATTAAAGGGSGGVECGHRRSGDKREVPATEKWHCARKQRRAHPRCSLLVCSSRGAAQ